MMQAAVDCDMPGTGAPAGGDLAPAEVWGRESEDALLLALAGHGGSEDAARATAGGPNG